MKKIKAKEIILITALFVSGLLGACNRSTTVERNVKVGPGDTVTHETRVHEDTWTGGVSPEADVDVHTKVDTH